MSSATIVRAAESLVALRTNPTLEDWRLVLECAIAGSPEVERLGQIDDFVDTLIENSKEPVLCKESFCDAVERVVAPWDPAAPAKSLLLDNMLRLVMAFRPPSGFVNLVGFLDKRRPFICTDAPPESRISQLYELALAALRRYFPVSPTEAVPAFESYTRVLRRMADDGPARGHALQRLLELGIWSVDHKRTQFLVDGYFHEVLPPLLDWLLSSDWSDRKSLISRLYGRSLRDPESRRMMEAQLTDYEVMVLDGNKGPILQLESRVQIELILDNDDLDRHASELWSTHDRNFAVDTIEKLVTRYGIH